MIRWIALLALPALLFAADETAAPELPAAVRPLIELARSAQPEFFADTVVRMIEAGKIPQVAAQVSVLQEAFDAAAAAQEPMRLVDVSGTPSDTRAIYRSKAGELGFDALSLQSRVLKTMLTVDRRKARELFERITRPALDARTCEDPLVPDVSAYYKIAGAIAQSAFTPEEKARGLHVQFLLTLLSGARSPVELAPFARAIQSVDLKPADWSLLLNAIAGKMETIGADYRTFAMSIGSLRTEIEHLSQTAQSLNLRSDLLPRAVRAYLVNQLTAPRCADDSAGDSLLTQQQVDWFNTKFRGDLPPIGEDEASPSGQNGKIQADPYFNSADSKRIADMLSALRNTPDRSTAEWRGALDDFTRAYEDWTPEGSDLDVFHQRATVLLALFQAAAPPSEDRDRIMSLCVGLLQSSDAERESPGEWLWEAKTLQEAAGADSAKLVQAFRSSSDPNLVLFAISGFPGRSMP